MTPPAVATERAELRVLPLGEAGIEVREGGQGPVLSGYAAVFDTLSGDLGGFVERIRPGAFRDALQTSDVRGLFNHVPDNLLGREGAGTLRLREDDRGLRFEIDLDSDPVADFVRRKVQRRELTGASFAFNVAEDGDEVTYEGGRRIRTILPGGIRQLFDVGPVTFPAYEATSVSARALERLRGLPAGGAGSIWLPEPPGPLGELNLGQLLDYREALRAHARPLIAEWGGGGPKSPELELVNERLRLLGWYVTAELEETERALEEARKPAPPSALERAAAIREGGRDPWRVAVHEAGHAVFGVLVGAGCERVSFRFERTEEGRVRWAGGEALMKAPQRAGDAGRMAGLAAEEVCDVRTVNSWGLCDGDRAKVRGDPFDATWEARKRLAPYRAAIEEVARRLLEFGELGGEELDGEVVYRAVRRCKRGDLRPAGGRPSEPSSRASFQRQRREELRRVLEARPSRAVPGGF